LEIGCLEVEEFTEYSDIVGARELENDFLLVDHYGFIIRAVVSWICLIEVNPMITRSTPVTVI
jgi:hypothetical protein